MKNLLTLLIVMILAGCSSAQRVPTPENHADKVLSTSDEAKSDHPSWLRKLEERPMQIDDHVVTVLGQAQIPADHRLEAGYRIADIDGKRLLCNSIQQRLSYVMDHAEDGTSYDAQQSRFIAAEACKITTSGIRPGQRYYEKVSVATDEGTLRTVYRIFTTQTMSEDEFQRQVLKAAKNSEGKQGISPGFAKMVDQHWQDFVAEGGEAVAKTEDAASKERTPSSNESPKSQE